MDGRTEGRVVADAMYREVNLRYIRVKEFFTCRLNGETRKVIRLSGYTYSTIIHDCIRIWTVYLYSNYMYICFTLGSIGCWTRLNSETGGLDPIGASQDLKLEQIVYQEAGEYKCIAPTQDTDKRKKLDSLRNSYSVEVVVKGISYHFSSMFNLVSCLLD